MLAAEAERQRKDARASRSNFPTEPVRDVMLFLLEHAPLKPWQLDVLSIIRDEAYYFAPQAQTKIMNEGWASYWHSHDHDPPGPGAGRRDQLLPTTTPARWPASPTRLNPYKLGIELFRDIEDRWNRGRFGKEYDECDDLRQRRDWDTERRPGPARRSSRSAGSTTT